MTKTSKNWPWFRTLASFFIPGIGQAYNGQFRKALGVLSLFVVGYLVRIAAAILGGAALAIMMLSLSVVFVLLFVWSPIDAWRTARRQSEENGEVSKPFRRAVMYAIALLVAFLGAKLSRDFIAEQYVLPADSMAPTLLAGDRILVKKHVLMDVQRLKRGALIVYRAQNNTPYVKRVLGLPGDILRFRNGSFIINGKEEKGIVSSNPSRDCGEAFTADLQCVRESWDGNEFFVLKKVEAEDSRRIIEERMPFTQVTMPPGHYYLVGDNRDNSFDSRYAGLVPAADVLGIVSTVYFSIRPESLLSIRWNRIGRWLASGMHER